MELEISARSVEDEKSQTWWNSGFHNCSTGKRGGSGNPSVIIFYLSQPLILLALLGLLIALVGACLIVWLLINIVVIVFRL